MIWLLVGAMVPSMLVCWAAGWVIRRQGPRIGQVDRPGRRKVHTVPMPTSGGVAIWLGIVGPLAVGQLLVALLLEGRSGMATAAAQPAWLAPLSALVGPHLPGLVQQSVRLWSLLAGGTALLVLGLIDDRRGLDWRIRLAGQTLGALVMVCLGWRTTLLAGLPGADVLLSVLWIVGLINSFNMLRRCAWSCFWPPGPTTTNRSCSSADSCW
jgi:UDP-GlcNAc:undecaprenyl-phosphate GlcNAc-1-phosphate transferase